MSKSDYLENELLDAVYGSGSPATIYVGLSTANPLDDESGLAEPSGNNYSRAAVTNNATNWPAAASGSKSNGTDVTMPDPSGPWGTCTHFFTADGPDPSDNILHSGALTSSADLDVGSAPVRFLAGAIIITED